MIFIINIVIFSGKARFVIDFVWVEPIFTRASLNIESYLNAIANHLQYKFMCRKYTVFDDIYKKI